ncbi:hypothetical protein HII28_15645 [Planctomonas sp. JC2975]|uniref:hypothetical protein n=1 Tax=Planctomonas sp. JC2975 TaxID=2729626 RepID=UPI00147461DF|nr:hypothetical protein [Planctomonas sp. JC2975]NNC13304.1 hypothetical protein [Planctomonas sp. JC2975]
MITTQLARELKDHGLVWHPSSGDVFAIDSGEFDGETFTVSDMTIEAHEFDTGTILGFNGTTEWALDSVALDNALWLPREDQLRGLLGGTFASLSRAESGGFVVETARDGIRARFEATEAETAYAQAVLALIGQATEATA